MAVTVGRVEIDVDADGSGLPRQMRVIGRKAGAAGGAEMGKSLTEAFSRETTHFEKDGGITRIRESFKTIDKDFSKLSASVGSSSKRMGGHMNVFRGHIMRTIGAWTLLIAVIGQGTAVLGSGLGASLTSIISSIGFALPVALAAGGAAMTGFIWTTLHAVAALEMMDKQFPAAKRGMDNLAAAAKADSAAFAQAWGPALADFTNKLAELWRNDRMGEMAGAALGRITEAFTAVLESPAYQMFQTAMETTIPNSLANLGTGLASVVQGLLSIFSAVGPVLEEMSAAFADWAKGWGEMMQESAESGELTATFERMKESFDAVLGLVGALSGALSTLFTAGAPAGNALLGHLTGLLDKWNEWMQSVEGQTALQDWFANGQVIFMALLDLLGQLGPVLAALVTPEAVASLVTFMDSLGQALPILGEILALVGDLQVLNILAAALGAISAVLMPLMPILSEVASTIGTALLEGVEKLAPKFAELGTNLGPLLVYLGELIAVILPPLIDLIIAVVDVVNGWVEIMNALAGATEDNQGAFKVWSDVIGAVFKVVGGIIVASTQMWSGILKAIAALLKGDFSGAWKILEDTVKDVLASLGIDFDDLVQWFLDMSTGAEKALSEIGGFFEDMATNIGNAIQDAIGWIQDAIGWFGSLFGAANDAGNAMSGARGRSSVGDGGGAVPLASGGVLWGRTKALMGESGPEAVVPLRRNLSQVDPSVRWLSALAQGKYPALASGGVSTGVAGRSVLIQPGAIVVQGSGNPDVAAVGVVNRIAERLG